MSTFNITSFITPCCIRGSMQQVIRQVLWEKQTENIGDINTKERIKNSRFHKAVNTIARKINQSVWESIRSFICSFSKFLFSAYARPGTVWATRNTKVKRIVLMIERVDGEVKQICYVASVSWWESSAILSIFSRGICSDVWRTADSSFTQMFTMSVRLGYC